MTLQRTIVLATALTLGTASGAYAQLSIEMHMADEKGQGASIGTVSVEETRYGLVFIPQLKGLTPGLHGFHVHEHADCGPAEKDGKIVPAAKAGGHYDPNDAKQHAAPWEEGHLGDLPALYVDEQGNATHPVLAPRLRQQAQINGRTLMVHEGGDNYADDPKPLGGGGGRMACGIITAPD